MAETILDSLGHIQTAAHIYVTYYLLSSWKGGTWLVPYPVVENYLNPLNPAAVDALISPPLQHTAGYLGYAHNSQGRRDA